MLRLSAMKREELCLRIEQVQPDGSLPAQISCTRFYIDGKRMSLENEHDGKDHYHERRVITTNVVTGFETNHAEELVLRLENIPHCIGHCRL